MSPNFLRMLRSTPCQAAAVGLQTNVMSDDPATPLSEFSMPVDGLRTSTRQCKRSNQNLGQMGWVVCQHIVKFVSLLGGSWT